MGFAPSTMQLTSSAFAPMARIPKQYTGEGADISPPLAWRNAPPGTKAFALVCHDPDAPLVTPLGVGFTHWVLYNIPGSVSELREAEKGYASGNNSFGKNGYGGPMPPELHGVHHYYFWLLALRDDKKLPAGLSMQDLFAQIEPQVLGMNRLIGTYSRPT
jgi:Raf kinase inhibitor-like YbhB/YbcL family protein